MQNHTVFVNIGMDVLRDGGDTLLDLIGHAHAALPAGLVVEVHEDAYRSLTDRFPAQIADIAGRCAGVVLDDLDMEHSEDALRELAPLLNGLKCDVRKELSDARRQWIAEQPLPYRIAECGEALAPFTHHQNFRAGRPARSTRRYG